MTNGTEDGDLIDDSADRISVILGGILVVGSIAGTFLVSTCLHITEKDILTKLINHFKYHLRLIGLAVVLFFFLA